jgi:hypothetical protein
MHRIRVPRETNSSPRCPVMQLTSSAHTITTVRAWMKLPETIIITTTLSCLIAAPSIITPTIRLVWLTCIRTSEEVLGLISLALITTGWIWWPRWGSRSRIGEGLWLRQTPLVGCIRPRLPNSITIHSRFRIGKVCSPDCWKGLTLRSRGILHLKWCFSSSISSSSRKMERTSTLRDKMREETSSSSSRGITLREG